MHAGLVALAAGFVAAPYLGDGQPGPVLAEAAELVSVDPAVVLGRPRTSIAEKARNAASVLAATVRPLSHPKALETAFQSYFAYKAAHPEKVRKPFLYFVDFGLPATQPRGYVFDMTTLEVVDGPFTVAHGRGSARSGSVAARFSNRAGSKATSLGLYAAAETYSFRGRAGGRPYRSIGLRLDGLSGEYNDNARNRGIVVHGAPYVTSRRAGASEGCPAMEPARARRLLPQLANGGIVFHFAPVAKLMRNGPWIVAGRG